MHHLISPSFTHEKLEPPLYKDVLDVFEDRIRYWLLAPAKRLLKIKHGSIAAVSLATTYIEGIEIFVTGKDSKGKSKEFFRRGYKRVFSPVGGHKLLEDAIAEALYELLRCGFAHDGMFRSGIYFSNLRKEAITVTWPRKNGAFDPQGKLESAVINPHRFVACIELHFDEYMKQLRSKVPGTAKDRFMDAIAIKWRLGKPGHLVGMSESEFAGEA
jgi:hypothetical protein